MLIRSPCLLGEKFTHHRKWGACGSALHLFGADFFLWSCGLEPITLHGDQTLKGNDGHYSYGLFQPDDTDDLKIIFEVPDIYFSEQGVPLRELGIPKDKNGRISGIRMKGEKDWYYRIGLAPGHGDCIEARSEELDKLFAPLLPAVSVDLLNFL